MATYVLVHGAWHGGWCWRRVAERLRAAGHEVFTPTLTGLGERSHLLDPAHDVNLHVQDVLNVLRFEDLREVVLVGHSYGGMVVTGVASLASERVRALVYLDAFLPRDGQSMVDLRDAAWNQAIPEMVRRTGTDWRMAPPPAAALHIQREEDRRWVDSLMTDVALRCYTEPIRLGRGSVARRVYVRAADYPYDSFDALLDAAEEDPAWESHRVPGGHDLMVDSPDEVAAILLGLA